MPTDLFVPILGIPGDVDALDSGIALATAWRARLAVLDLLDLPVPAGGAGSLWPGVAAHVRERLHSIQSAAGSGSDGGEGAGGLRVDELSPGNVLFAPWRTATRVACCSDLTVMAGPAEDPALFRTAHDVFAGVLLGSGRPVLVVPPGRRVQAPVRRVVIAWSPAPASARALHDALPILRGAGTVQLLRVAAADGDASGEADAVEAGAALLGHLSRHGIDAALATIANRSGSVASTIADFAEDQHADLVVAGGYGHSRAREWWLGGVTRELFRTARVPVFWSN